MRCPSAKGSWSPGHTGRDAARTVRARGPGDGLPVPSFDWRTLNEVRRIGPEIVPVALTEVDGRNVVVIAGPLAGTATRPVSVAVLATSGCCTWRRVRFETPISSCRPRLGASRSDSSPSPNTTSESVSTTTRMSVTAIPVSARELHPPILRPRAQPDAAAD